MLIGLGCLLLGQIFDSAAWSSLLDEGFVGANVKDEPKLPRFKKPAGGASNPVIPKDGAMAAKAAAQGGCGRPLMWVGEAVIVGGGGRQGGCGRPLMWVGEAVTVGV